MSEVISTTQQTVAELTNAAQYAGLQAQIVELTAALKSEQDKVKRYAIDAAQELDRKVEAEIADRTARQRAVEEAAEQKAKTNKYGRPESYAEYAGLSFAEKAVLLELYGSELVNDLLAKKQVLDAQIRADEVQRTIARNAPRFSGKR